MRKTQGSLCCIVLVFVMLSGCTGAQPKAIVMPPASSASVTPTFTPSATPSPTITPTPQPPTPEGAQGFDSVRNLATKDKNGTTYYYIPEIKDWVIALNQKPIWLVNQKNSASNIADVLPSGYKSMSVYYYRLPGAPQTFNSVEEPEEYTAGSAQNGSFVNQPNMFHSTQDYVTMALAQRLNQVEGDAVTESMMREVLKKIGDHSLILGADVPVVAKDNSQVTTKYWDPNKNIDFVQVPWDSTNNDASFFGRLAYTYRWKLDVRGGLEKSNPGNLVILYATTYNLRLHDWEEADIHLLGPIYAALVSQQLPRLDYISFSAIDLNNFIGEFYTLYKPKKLGKAEEDKIWQTFRYSQMTDFAYSASVPAALNPPYATPPFLEYTCFHFDKSGAKVIEYCYAPSQYLILKANGK